MGGLMQYETNLKQRIIGSYNRSYLTYLLLKRNNSLFFFPLLSTGEVLDSVVRVQNWTSFMPGAKGLKGSSYFDISWDGVPQLGWGYT